MAEFKLGPDVQQIEEQTGTDHGVDPAARFYLEDTRKKDWLDLANCASVGGDEFFAEKGGSSSGAKLVCAACVVRTECVQSILTDTTEVKRFGVWGGLSPNDRRLIKDYPPQLANDYIAKVHADADKRLKAGDVA